MGDLAGVYQAALLILGAILLSIALGGGFALFVAARAVRRAEPARASPPAWVGAASLVLVVAAAGITLAPLAVAVLAPTLYGSDSLPSDTGTVVVIMFALGVLSVSAARLLRHGAALGNAAALLVAVLLVPAAIQVWVTTEMVQTGTRHAASEAELRVRTDRFADLINGPSVGEIVAAVGSVGTWRPMGGGLEPALISDEWRPDQRPVADLTGRQARFAVLAQCWVKNDPGGLSLTVHDFASGTMLNTQFGRCDGTLQTFVTDPIQLPEWSDQRLAEARASERDLLAVTASAATSRGARPVAEIGEVAAALRYVVFVSAEPATPSSELTDAVTEAAGSFTIR